MTFLSENMGPLRSKFGTPKLSHANRFLILNKLNQIRLYFQFSESIWKLYIKSELFHLKQESEIRFLWLPVREAGPWSPSPFIAILQHRGVSGRSPNWASIIPRGVSLSYGKWRIFQCVMSRGWYIYIICTLLKSW